MHICVCMNICINWGGIYWPKTKVLTKSKARHVWYVLANVSNDHRLCFFRQKAWTLFLPSSKACVIIFLKYKQIYLFCLSFRQQRADHFNSKYDIALHLYRKWLKTTTDVIRRCEIYLKFIFFISALWGVKSLQPSSSSFHVRMVPQSLSSRNSIMSPTAPSLSEKYFLVQMEMKELRSASCSRAIKGGKPRISAQWYHTAWFFYEEEIDEGKKYILISTEYCAL